MGIEVIQIGSQFMDCYLLKGDRIALVDTLASSGYKKILKVLQKHGVGIGDIEFVLLTHSHYDHCGNAAKIKELSGATVIAGAEDAPVIEGKAGPPPMSTMSVVGRAMTLLPRSWLDRYQKYDPVEVDRGVKAGDMIEELGLEVIGLPGHTCGGVGYLDREGKRAFIGDMVSSFFGMSGMPALCASESLEDIRASQELLSMLDLDIAYPGHGSIIQPNASKVIGEFVAKKKAKAK